MFSHPDRPRPLIAASIGPYGAYLANGSEYHGNYGISDQMLTDFHEPRIWLLEQTPADMLACETIPSYQEAKVLSKILENTCKPAWICFSCKDDQHTCDGTPIETCAALFAQHPNVFAIGVNCTAPEHISGLIQCIKKKSGDKKIVVYPNSGAVYDPESKTWIAHSKSIKHEAMIREWLSLGADIIGGCCGVGPEEIRAMGSIIHQ
jgi:homocysteine S-methyltransferase